MLMLKLIKNKTSKQQNKQEKFELKQTFFLYIIVGNEQQLTKYIVEY